MDHLGFVRVEQHYHRELWFERIRQGYAPDQYRVDESASGLTAPFEDEDDDKHEDE
jgi:hypothetical protein